MSLNSSPRLSRRIRLWLVCGGTIACVLLLLREIVSIDWLHTTGHINSESSMGVWSGPTIWTVLLFLLAPVVAVGWVAIVVSACTRPTSGLWCRRCGYSLSGVAPDRPCPECGVEREP
jgi:hypothetical protein